MYYNKMREIIIILLLIAAAAIANVERCYGVCLCSGSVINCGSVTSVLSFPSNGYHRVRTPEVIKFDSHFCGKILLGRMLKVIKPQAILFRPPCDLCMVGVPTNITLHRVKRCSKLLFGVRLRDFFCKYYML